MNLLFVASECAPFIKTGGLADVIGAVPKALNTLGVSVKVLIPSYASLDNNLRSSAHPAMHFDDLFGGPARLLSVQADGIDLLLLEAPHLFDRPGNPYVDATQTDWPDNHLRFAALSWVGAHLGLKGIDSWHPDVIHAHDWQAGLVPAYLKQTSPYAPPVVMTIHNIAFQGLFPKSALAQTGISEELFTPDGVEYYDQLGYLKGGIKLADYVTTVSPTYSRELLTEQFGMGLEGLLRSRESEFRGIINGIDPTIWNPATDPHIEHHYDADNIDNKFLNHAAVRKRFGLSPSAHGPLYCVVSRLTHQKGLDLLIDCLPTLVESGGQLALLGTGEPELERAFEAAAQQYRGSIGVIIGYDEPLSHLMQAGSDVILIPSRFEPCGLTQLYGLRYGTLPIVARTGGLADTVIDANDAALQRACATGFQFAPVTADALKQTISRVAQVFSDETIWRSIMQHAMQQDVGWEQSAKTYLGLYQSLTKQ